MRLRKPKTWSVNSFEIFGRENYFVEIHDHGIAEQQKIIPDLRKIAKDFDLKIVAANDVHYVNAEDWNPHDALLCIQTGSRWPTRSV